MKRTVLLVVWALTVLASSAQSDEIAGTRPGPEGEPLKVAATLFLLDVSKITGADQSFTADVFLLMQWRDERLASSEGGIRRVDIASIWNPRIQIINQRRIWKTFPEAVDIAPNGAVTYRQRFYGQFASPLDLHDFPLDEHRFSVQLVIPGYSPEDIVLVPFTEGFERLRSHKMSIPDWTISEFELEKAPWSIVEGGRQIAGLEGTFTATRHLGFYIGKAFVSVAIIVFMSWVVFWLGPANVGPRLSVSVTSMLTLIAYRFLLGQSLPPVSYLTRLDYFLLGSTILVFIALIEVAATSSMPEQRAEALNRYSRWVFPLAFAVLLIVSFGLG
jgi:hypothetical protein